MSELNQEKKCCEDCEDTCGEDHGCHNRDCPCHSKEEKKAHISCPVCGLMGVVVYQEPATINDALKGKWHECSGKPFVTKDDSGDKCPCACHENKLNKPYEHDRACCDDMNGMIIGGSVGIMCAEETKEDPRCHSFSTIDYRCKYCHIRISEWKNGREPEVDTKLEKVPEGMYLCPGDCRPDRPGEKMAKHYHTIGYKYGVGVEPEEWEIEFDRNWPIDVIAEGTTKWGDYKYRQLKPAIKYFISNLLTHTRQEEREEVLASLEEYAGEYENGIVDHFVIKFIKMMSPNLTQDE